jgi:hypothetical protein
VSQDSERIDAAAIVDAAPAQAPEQPEPVAAAAQEQPSVGAMAVDDHTLAGGDDDDDCGGPSESPVRLIDMSSKSLTQEPVAAPVVSEPAAEPVAVSAPAAAAPIAAPAKVDAAPTPSKASLNSATMAVLSATSSVTRPKPMSMMAVLKQRLQAQGIQMEDVGTPLRHPTKDRAKPAAGRRPPSRPASRPASPKIASPAPIAVAEPMAAAAPVVDTAVPVDEDVEEEVMQVGHVEADLAVTTSIAREEALPTLVQQAPDLAPAVMHTAARASIADDFEIHGANVQMLVTGDASESRKRKSSGDASAEIERAASMQDDEHDDERDELTRVDQDNVDANEHENGDDDNDDDDDDEAREPANDSDDELDGAAPSGKQHVSSGDKPQVKRARPAEADAADPAAAAALRTADERVRLAREKRAALEKARAEEQTKRDELRRMRDERRRREAEEAERKKNEVKEQRRQRLEAKIRRKREEREVAVGAKAPTEAEASTAIARPRVADEIRKPIMPVAAAASAAAPVATGALAPIAAVPIAAAAAASAPVVAVPIAAAVTAKTAEPAIADMSAPLATPMVRKGPMALFGKLFGGLGSPQGTTSMTQATTTASAAAVVAASSPVRRAGPASAAAWATSSTLAANSHTASLAATGASLPSSAAQPSALPQPKVVRELQTSVSASAATAAPSASVAAKTLMPPPINYIRSPPPVNNSSPRTLAAVGTQQTAQGVSPAVESYIMSDCSEEEDSGMSPETPEKRGKKVPLWAKRDALFRALQQQNVDPDEVFGPDLAPVDLEELFGAQRARYRRRASSANWQVDGLSTQENSRYKEKLFKGSGLAHSVAQPHNK